MSPAFWIRMLLTATLAGVAAFAPVPGLETAAARASLVIFATAAGLWVTELIPPFATGALVIVASVGVLGHPAVAGEAAWDAYLQPVASSPIVLFFGGFVLAQAAQRHGFDLRLASWFLMPFGTRPAAVLIGVILITALFSAFMSNTATAAMMLAIIGPLARRGELDANGRKRLVLGVAFAANIGGMATLIGTPPNAVAASVMAQRGDPITFLEWMLMAAPLTVILLAILWLLLVWSYPIRARELHMDFAVPGAVTWRLVVVVAVFTATVGLWLTEPLHGLPSAVVALLPIGVLAPLGLFDRSDLRQLDWDVLILVAGGMVLGAGLTRTGLSEVLVGLLPIERIGTAGLPLLLAAAALAMSNFMSNTAAANMLIPIGVSLGAVSPLTGAVAVALSASLAMSLPISTPPNAMAYATGLVTTGDMLRCGTLVSLVGAALVLVMLLVKF